MERDRFFYDRMALQEWALEEYREPLYRLMTRIKELITSKEGVSMDKIQLLDWLLDNINEIGAELVCKEFADEAMEALRPKHEALIQKIFKKEERGDENLILM
jgi:hypothetical protein